MQKFLKSSEYKTLKKKYEKEHFKLFGKYAWFDGDKLIHVSQAEVKEYFKNKKVTIEIEDENEDGEVKIVKKTKTFYQVWSEDPEMKEYKEVIFNCNLSKVKKYQFNLFTGFNHFDNNKVPDVDLEIVYDHFRSLVNYNENHFNYVLNFLAQIVQQPHVLIHILLVFISNEGVGKDLNNNFISESLGEKYTINTDKLELLCGKFNSCLGGKLLATINETDPVESRQRIDNIKYLSTANKVVVEGKYKDPIKSDNFCRLIFFSNRLCAFPVEEGSRRPVIFECSKKYLKETIGAEENKKYFDKLASVYKNKDYQHAFLEMLKKRDISKWNPHEFEKTKLHETLEENNTTPLVTYLASIVNENKFKDVVRISTATALKEFSEMLKKQNYKFDYSQSKFNVELENKFGIEKVKNGIMKFVFNIPQLKEVLQTKYKYNFQGEEEDDGDDENIPTDKKIENIKNQIYGLEQELIKLNKKLLEEKKLKEETKEDTKSEVEEKPQKVKKSKKKPKEEESIEPAVNMCDKLMDGIISSP